MKKLFCLCACVLGFIGSANATLLTFDGNGVLSDEFPAGYTGIGDTYKQDGYTFTVGIGDHFDVMNSSGINWHDGSANNQTDNYAYLSFSGGLFDLTSFDLTTYAGDLITNLTAIASYGVGTNVVNINGLTWAAFSPTGAGSSNIYVDDISVRASSVPEPSVLALFGLGLAGILFSRRKKK